VEIAKEHDRITKEGVETASAHPEMASVIDGISSEAAWLCKWDEKEASKTEKFLTEAPEKPAEGKKFSKQGGEMAKENPGKAAETGMYLTCNDLFVPEGRPLLS
jgi:hypothetical protein